MSLSNLRNIEQVNILTAYSKSKCIKSFVYSYERSSNTEICERHQQKPDTVPCQVTPSVTSSIFGVVALITPELDSIKRLIVKINKWHQHVSKKFRFNCGYAVITIDDNDEYDVVFEDESIYIVRLPKTWKDEKPTIVLNQEYWNSKK